MKIVVVTHHEGLGSMTDGAHLTEKIEESLTQYSSNEWSVLSATTAIHAPHDPEDGFRPDTAYATTIILVKK